MVDEQVFQLQIAVACGCYSATLRVEGIDSRFGYPARGSLAERTIKNELSCFRRYLFGLVKKAFFFET